MASTQTPQPGSSVSAPLPGEGAGSEGSAPAGGAAVLLAEHRLHRVEAAAVYLNIKRTKAYEEIRLGRLRTVRIGRRRLVPPEYIDEYVELLKREAEAA